MAVLSAAAFAHQPRLVGDAPAIDVRNPEISQAFYARLAGRPQRYRILCAKPFLLYVNLLVPDLPGIDTDYRAVIYRSGETPGDIVAVLDGRAFTWKPFFEPFGGDHYLVGPECQQDVPAGSYIIVVSSPDFEGRYALAIGKEERFPVGEILRTIAVLPRLKKDFFGKSPLAAFFNLSGVFLLVVAGIATGLALIFVILRRRLRRSRG